MTSKKKRNQTILVRQRERKNAIVIGFICTGKSLYLKIVCCQTVRGFSQCGTDANQAKMCTQLKIIWLNTQPIKAKCKNTIHKISVQWPISCKLNNTKSEREGENHRTVDALAHVLRCLSPSACRRCVFVCVHKFKFILSVFYGQIEKRRKRDDNAIAQKSNR